MDYQSSGVDVSGGEKFVNFIQNSVPTHTAVKKGVGGFAALYTLNSEQFLAASMDGVGTKLLLAENRFDYKCLGQDLVAMNENDLLCVNADPLFFLDYMSFGKLCSEKAQALLEGIIEALGPTPLLGGETAEMPGVYPKEGFDLAGTMVGMVQKKNIIDEEKIEEGDVLVGLLSSGFHSNGYSLLRKVMKSSQREMLMTPTKLYRDILKKITCPVKAKAHITGGGWRNLLRMHPRFGFKIFNTPKKGDLPESFTVLNSVNITEEEQFKTWNMGIGFALVVSRNDVMKIKQDLDNKDYMILGEVCVDRGVHFPQFSLN